MKKVLCFWLGQLLLILAGSTAIAECVPGTNWTATWTDSYSQTSYQLEAPCKAYIGIPFDITATVTDASYPNSDVAMGWALLDNGTVILGGGFNWLTLAAGQWQRTYTQVYSGVPIDHTIEFRFTDLGQGAGAHYYNSSLIGGLTIDPYPPGANPPTADAGPDLTINTAQQNTTLLAGSAADADGDPLTYRWLAGTTVLQSSRSVDPSGTATLDLGPLPSFPPGVHTLTLEVSDGTLIGTDDVQLTVVSPVSTAVPVLNGWWLLPALIAGAVLMARERGRSARAR